MRVEFNTNDFQFSHGHKPKGNGLWLFEVWAVKGDGTLVLQSRDTRNGTITEAKAKIKADLSVKAIGRRSERFFVTVLP
jgi:hypothetical protein